MMIKVLFLAALVNVLVAAEDDLKNIPIYGPFDIIDMPKLWNLYKTTYNKSYSKVEESKRKELFEKAVKYVVNFNLNSISNTDMPLTAINAYSDCFREECGKMRGFKNPKKLAQEAEDTKQSTF